MTSEVTERSVGLIQYRIPDPYRRLMVGAPTPIVNYVHFSGKGYTNIPTEGSEYLIQFNDFPRTIRSAFPFAFFITYRTCK